LAPGTADHYRGNGRIGRGAPDDIEDRLVHVEGERVPGLGPVRGDISEWSVDRL
jgi:hypothetical protein